MSIYSRPPVLATHYLSALLERSLWLLRAIAFWMAITFPVGYVALMTLPDPVGIEIWTVALGAHVVCLLLGHAHLDGRESVETGSEVTV